jgi:hypothetical protein
LLEYIGVLYIVRRTLQEQLLISKNSINNNEEVTEEHEIFLTKRKLNRKEEDKFRNFALSNNPIISKFNNYHPICRLVWLEQERGQK